jgi:Holliday junction resolvasome RuvABC DNA-binding subunit
VAREHTDAMDALIGLGYSQQEAREALKNLPKDVVDLQAKIKIALKSLSK